MRTSIVIACALVFVAAAAGPRPALAASSPDDFYAWAKAKSGEFDSRWERISAAAQAPVEAAGASRLSREPDMSPAGPSGPERGDRPSTVSSNGFIHRPASAIPFLPLSTRDRGGPSRGMGALTSPASARLAVPHKIRRPVGSLTVQAPSRFSTFGDSVSRPRLKSFGRWSKSHRAFGGVQRPASRVDRPKL